MRSFKLLISALGLAVALASSADAGTMATKHKSHQRVVAGSAGSLEVCRGAGNFRCGAVYNGKDYLGNDPDSFVRLMIQRDLSAHYGGQD